MPGPELGTRCLARNHINTQMLSLFVREAFMLQLVLEASSGIRSNTPTVRSAWTPEQVPPQQGPLSKYSPSMNP